MDWFQAALFSAPVLVIAAVMLTSHVAHWKELKANKDSLDPAEHDFRYRQCRRRLQASSLLALVGVAMFVGQLIDVKRHPSFFVYFWCAVALLVLWIVLLALADAFATRMRLLRLKQDRLIETARLQARLRGAKAGRNGATDGDGSTLKINHQEPNTKLQTNSKDQEGNNQNA